MKPLEDYLRGYLDGKAGKPCETPTRPYLSGWEDGKHDAAALVIDQPEISVSEF